MKKWIAASLAALSLMAAPLAASASEAAPAIDWNTRYTYAELEGQLTDISASYDDITTLYPIGHTWQERALWCMEITNYDVPAEEKTGVAVFGNIHGGERESGACAMYFAWWLTANSDTERVSEILDNYIVYVIPVINPDGYEQSFVYNNRPNLRPNDANGDGVAFSDPYTDIDGDGYIATLYRGTADAQPERRGNPVFGMESCDWDKNGILGDDPRTSGIDMNRTFDYQWKRFDIETVNSEEGVIGANAYGNGGPAAASEPEVQAVQNFLLSHSVDALATLHTGIQCVLYPWCYRPYNEEIDTDLVYMDDVASRMAAAFQETTGRGFYYMQSYYDYPTSAELIDWSYGRLNIYSYTIEVYNGGKSADGNIEDCKWENTLPEETWVFYSQEDLAAMGIDTANLTDRTGEPLKEGEGLWFYTSATAQMVDKAPEGQDVMVEGCKDALLVMIDSVPYGEGYTKPEYLNW